jgi:hypothetical protein
LIVKIYDLISSCNCEKTKYDQFPLGDKDLLSTATTTTTSTRAEKNLNQFSFRASKNGVENKGSKKRD